MPFELRLQKVSWRKGKSIPGMDADCNGTELSPRVALRVGVRASRGPFHLRQKTQSPSHIPFLREGSS